jgi:catechol 2,3-dioxygenase-like lactoylglutathione lyase family enzyme
MIQVHDVIDWTGTLSSQRIEIESIDRVQLVTPDLQRSVGFYTRAFGFRSVGTPEKRPQRSAVLISAASSAELVIHETIESGAPMRNVLQRWGFVVVDIDWVRRAVWDLGIGIAKDNGEPDQIYRWENGRTLYILDPDANVIELVDLDREYATARARAGNG